MAVPSSGQLSLRGIHQELTLNDYNDDDYDEAPAGGYSLTNASNGTYGTINTNNAASDRPDGSAPHAMSEFYSYNHSAAGTSFSSVYSNFTLSVATNTAAGYSSVKTFVVNNGSGALTISIGSIAPNSGTLSVAASSTGDPGTSGTSNSGTGFVNEGSTLSHTPGSWGSSKTIYLRFKLVPHTSSAGDSRTVTISNNGVSTAGGAVYCESNPPKSDIRLKTNIDRIGYSGMNIPIYLFNYKNDLNTTYKGVMAQDLLELGFDDSVILDSDGYYSVDYNSIDVDMERV